MLHIKCYVVVLKDHVLRERMQPRDIHGADMMEQKGKLFLK